MGDNFVASWNDGTDCEGVGWWYGDRDSADLYEKKGPKMH